MPPVWFKHTNNNNKQTNKKIKGCDKFNGAAVTFFIITEVVYLAQKSDRWIQYLIEFNFFNLSPYFSFAQRKLNIHTA